MRSSVYGLINGDTMELRYIGQTTNSMQRLRIHKLAKSHNPHLNNWLRATNWNMITLERDPDDIDEAEIRWIREMREQGARLLNIEPGGNGRSFETRAKISAAKKGRPHSDEHRAKISIAMIGHKNGLGYRHSAETRARMSVSHIGRPVSAETRAKLRAAMVGNWFALGSHRSPEVCAKMSGAIRAAMTSEVRARMRASHTGLHHSDATRTKISVSQKRRRV